MTHRSAHSICTECKTPFVATGGARGPLPEVCSPACKRARKARVVAGTDRPRKLRARCLNCGVSFIARAGHRGPFPKTCSEDCRADRANGLRRPK